MEKYNRYFLLFANCIPVKGASRSTICDLQNGTYYFIPNGLVEILEEMKSNLVIDVFNANKSMGLTERLLDSYLDYLQEENLGFYTESKDEFPELNLDFQMPRLIYDCIIEWSALNSLMKNEIIRLLLKTGCQQIEMRLFDSKSIELLPHFLELVSTSTYVRNIVLISPFDEEKIIFFNELLMEFPILETVVLSGGFKNDNMELNDRIRIIKEEVNNSDCCGNAGRSYNVTLQQFSESQKYNSCLNKKLSISEKGEILNCPSIKKNFANIADETLDIIKQIESEEFQLLWSVNKNQIKTCKNCEFRFICLDCRAFVENILDKPQKCNYNPYTMIYE